MLVNEHFTTRYLDRLRRNPVVAWLVIHIPFPERQPTRKSNLSNGSSVSISDPNLDTNGLGEGEEVYGQPEKPPERLGKGMWSLDEKRESAATYKAKTKIKGRGVEVDVS